MKRILAVLIMVLVITSFAMSQEVGEIVRTYDKMTGIESIEITMILDLDISTKEFVILALQSVSTVESAYILTYGVITHDWYLLEDVMYLIDGERYSSFGLLGPIYFDTKSKASEGMVSQMFMFITDRDFLVKLANSDEAIIRLSGSRRLGDYELQSDHRESIALFLQETEE